MDLNIPPAMYHSAIAPTYAWRLAAYILAALERARVEERPAFEVLDPEILEDLAASTVGCDEAERIISLFA
jgi:hypothetical protein